MKLDVYKRELVGEIMIHITHKGSFSNTEKFLSRAKALDIRRILERYAARGVTALSQATPVDTSKTSLSWYSEVKVYRGGRYTIKWFNRNEKDGVSIALLLQYGHGTRNGSYVQGIDYINPALKPIFEEIADEVWKEVTRI